MSTISQSSLPSRRHINVFTHNDLDGVACAVLLSMYAKQIDAGITVVYCTPGTVYDELKKLKSILQIAYETDVATPIAREIYVTDIALGVQSAGIMEWFLDHGCSVESIDHHALKTHHKYPWMTVTSSPSICAADLVMSFLGNYKYIRFPSAVDDFVRHVSGWDSHRFPVAERREYEDYNLALKALGEKSAQSFFFGALMEEPNQPLRIKDTYLGPVVDELYGNQRKYCALHGKNTFTFTDQGYCVVAVFADQFVSSVADYVLDHHPEADICAVIQMPVCVSLRTRNPGIDLFTNFAMPRGGWGHAGAAAFPIKDKITSQILSPIIDMSIMGL